ncbi:MAG TPA: DASS family sodium-coupled anion symporter [Saprospiraceae bacterium]|nr:DASS family sodium-coupled anion symporter [Saprospiraceae bacterium]HMP13790.1 DASS family sodium-coupled anion symporter [Saprospiraceae bacterium]
MDSRFDALKLFRKGLKWLFGEKIGFFFVALFAALWLTNVTKSDNFSQSAVYTLFLVYFSVGLWLLEAIPPFAVGLLIIGFQVTMLGSSYFNTHPEDVSKYVNTWASPVIWLMLGGFFIAEALRRTQLDRMLFRFATSFFGNSPSRILLGIMLTTLVLSNIMSNTATAAMMIASVMPFLDTLAKNDTFKKAMLLGIPTAAALGGMGTIIGSPPNAIAAGAMSAYGASVNFVEWMAYGVPVSLIITFAFWKLLLRRYPPQVAAIKIHHEHIPHTAEVRLQRRIVIITLVVTLGLWLTSPLHRIPVAGVSVIPIVFLTITGILGAEDMRGLPWDTLMLVAGGLSLGVAITETGLAEHYISLVRMDGVPTTLILLGFGLITVLFSNIMSNTATSTILIPVAAILMHDQVFEVSMIVGLCASAALLLPVSTPPNAIAFSTGHLQQSDFRFGGLLIGLLGPVLITGWVLLLKIFL